MSLLSDHAFIVVNKKEKSKELNEMFKRRILKLVKKEGYLPTHIRALEELLDQNIEILENFYEFVDNDEVEEGSSFKTSMKIGILNKNKEHAADEIGFIFGTDENYDLYSGLAEIQVIVNQKNTKKIPSTTFVCSKASLSCPKCPSPGVLTVTSQGIETNNGFLIATEGEISSTNIKFPKCGKSSCSFAQAGSWHPVSAGVTIDDQKQLLNTSEISCVRGGTVSIIDANCKENGD
ncbi:MAG: DUF4280 domain-containing protein [Methanobrevibacter sp.]|jgi:hypothetical protein|nr:DUF4280 domain-containing protein [Candidatus Methanovirga meridionalis]